MAWEACQGARERPRSRLYLRSGPEPGDADAGARAQWRFSRLPNSSMVKEAGGIFNEGGAAGMPDAVPVAAGFAPGFIGGAQGGGGGGEMDQLRNAVLEAEINMEAHVGKGPAGKNLMATVQEDVAGNLDDQNGPHTTQLARAMLALSTAEDRRSRLELRGTSGHEVSFVDGPSTHNNHHGASFELKALRAPITGLTCFLNEAGAAQDQVTVSVFTTRTPITRLEDLEYNSTPENRVVWSKQPEWQEVFVNQEYADMNIDACPVAHGRDKADPATQHEKSLLRSVGGAGCWLARQSRPDLVFEIPRLQQSLPCATAQTLREANLMWKRARVGGSPSGSATL